VGSFPPLAASSQEQTVHVLTKVFVVIASLLAVALSALVTANATNTDRVVRAFRDMESAQRTAEAALRSSEHQHLAELAVLTSRLTAANKDVEARNAEILRFSGEVSTLRKEKQDANNRAASIEGKISQLGEVAKTQATIIGSMRSEVTTLRDNELDFRRSNWTTRTASTTSFHRTRCTRRRHEPCRKNSWNSNAGLRPGRRSTERS